MPNKRALLEAVQLASQVVPKSSPKPILTKLLYAGDSVTATDLETSVTAQIAGGDKCKPCLLPADKFLSILRECVADEVSIKPEKKSATITAGASEFRLLTEDPAGYPGVQELAVRTKCSLPAHVLRQMVARTVFATDDESSRYALGGVMFEFSTDKLTCVATDGRRLSVVHTAVSVEGECEPVIVPIRPLRMLPDEGEVTIEADANAVRFTAGGVVIVSRLVEGRFPTWGGVIPKPDIIADATTELPITELLSVVRQAAVMVTRESRGVLLAFGSDKLCVSAATEQGDSKIEMPIPWSAEPKSVTLDPSYLVDCLKVLDKGSTVTATIRDAKSAVLLSVGEDFRYVVMPLHKD